jgi:hypothetical protein
VLSASTITLLLLMSTFMFRTLYLESRSLMLAELSIEDGAKIMGIGFMRCLVSFMKVSPEIMLGAEPSIRLFFYL